MTSVLNVDSIAAKDGTSPVTLTKQSANKSWINYSMSGTPAARDSFNHSSITDNAVGDGSLNFTNTFGAANYAFAGASCINDSTNDANIGIIGPRRATDTGITTAFARMHHIFNSAGPTTALLDNGVNGMMFDGDLA